MNGNDRISSIKNKSSCMISLTNNKSCDKGSTIGSINNKSI